MKFGNFVRPIAFAAAACLLFAAGSARAAAPAPAGDASATLNIGEKMTVLAWAGVPYDKASPARYAELAEAGINLNFGGAADAEMMQKLLDMAHAKGVKQLISFAELETSPEAMARRFKDHPGNGGYYLRDEPDATLFARLGAWAKEIQKADTVHPCYVNLLPTYADLGQLQAPSYAKYLELFVRDVPTQIFSWDHYPVIREGKDPAKDRLRPDFYNNLEFGSAAARKAGRPLWLFALATAHNPYPIAEVAHLRLQVFSNLAYGAQAIQYFTYWTPKSEVWNFHQGPIEVDGTRTPTYDRVKQVNGELQALRGAFLGSRVVSVGHTGDTIPAGTTRYAPAGAVKSLETQGGGAVVSMLERGDRRFLAVVNRDLHKPTALSIAFDPAAKASVAGPDGSLKPIDVSGITRSELEPGNIAVFSWQSR
jgi:hypothetical protein